MVYSISEGPLYYLVLCVVYSISEGPLCYVWYVVSVRGYCTRCGISVYMVSVTVCCIVYGFTGFKSMTSPVHHVHGRNRNGLT